MAPLAGGFPHTELRSGTTLFDVHNAGVLIRMGLNFESARFDVEWQVDNLLETCAVGAYRTARVLLTITGVTDFSGQGKLGSGPEREEEIDFIEYLPAYPEGGAIRFVFTASGEVLISGTDCELDFVVLTSLPGS